MAAGKNVGTISVAVTPDTRGFREAVKRVSGDLKADLRLQPILLKKDVAEAIKARNKNPSKTKLHVAIDITKKSVSKAIKERNASPTNTKLRVNVEFSKVQVREALKLATKDLAVKVHIVPDTKELAAAKAATRKTFKAIGDEEFAQNKINAVRTASFLNAEAKSRTRVEEAQAKKRVSIEKEAGIVTEKIRRDEFIRESVRQKQLGEIYKIAAKGRVASGLIAQKESIRASREAARLASRTGIKGGNPIAKFTRDLSRFQAQFFGFERAYGRALRFASLATAGFAAVIAGGFAFAVGKSVASLARLEVSARNAAVIFAELEPSVKRLGTAQALVAAQSKTTAQAIDAARKASLSSTFSAKDEADGLFFLASAGVKAGDAFKQLGNITRFAQAGEFDLSKAGELLLQSSNAAGLGVKHLSGVADLLTEANIRSQTTLEDLAVALSNKAAAAFHLANQPISQTVGLLQELGNVGITGRRAGENLAIAIREISRAASGAKDNPITKAFPSLEFKRIGVQVFDTSGRMKAFSTIVDELAKKLGKLHSKQLSLELKALGLTEKSNNAIRALIVRSNALKGGLTKAVADLVKNAAGSTAAIAKGQLQTLSAQFALFRNNVVALAQVFAGPLAAILTSIFHSLAGSGTLFDRFKDKAHAFGVELVKSLTPFLKSITGSGGKKLFIGIGESIKGTLRGIRDFGRTFAKAFNGGKKSSDGFLATLGKLLASFGRLISKIGPRIGHDLGFIAHLARDNAKAFGLLSQVLFKVYEGALILRVGIKPLLAIFSGFISVIQFTVRALTAEKIATEGAAVASTELAVAEVGVASATTGAAVAADAGAVSAKGLWLATLRVSRAMVGKAGLIGLLALGSYELIKWRAGAFHAQLQSEALSTRTDDLGKSISVVGKSLSSARGNLDIYRQSIKDTGTAYHNLAVSLTTRIKTTKNPNADLKAANDLLRTRLHLQDLVNISNNRRAASKASLITSLAQARTGLSILPFSIGQDSAELKQLRADIADEKRQRKNSSKGIFGPSINRLNALGVLGNDRKERELAIRLQDRLNKGLSEQVSLSKRADDLEKQINGTRRKTLADAVRSTRVRRFGADVNNPFAAEGAIHAGTVIGGAIKNANSVPQKRLERQIITDRNNFKLFSSIIVQLGTRIKGVVNTRNEISALGLALSQVGNTKTGHAFLSTFGPDIFKMIHAAKTGKDSTNALLRKIGSTRTGRVFLRSFGVDLDNIRVKAKKTAKQIHDDLITTTVKGAQDAASGAIASLFGTKKAVGKKKGVTAESAGSKLATAFTTGLNTGITKSFIPAVQTIVPKLSTTISTADKSGIVATGRSMVAGISTGIRSQLNDKSSLYKLLHVDIVDFIKKNKGPIEYDRTILIPAGHSIMDGLRTGLEQGFTPVKSFLRRVGPSMSEFVPDKLFGDRVAEFLVQGASTGTYPDPSTFFADLAQGVGGIGAATGIIDPALSFLHRTMSLSDTTQMANSLAKTFGLGVSSIYRPGAITASGNISDHSRGTAADFTGSVGALDLTASRIKPLFGNIFKQIIWRNHDLNNGAFIPHHGPGDNQHLHAAWLMANGFSLNSGKFGKSEGGLAAGSGPATPFNKFFAQAAAMFHVPASLLKAVTKAESSFNPNAGSSAGARGLMQLLPGTFASQHVGSNILDPRQNIFAGAKYLASQLNRFHNTSLAVAAYNAGPGAVSAAHGIPGFAETIAYVKRVLGYLADFGGFRAMGGGVSANKGYVVGERGPEYVVPRRSGFVLSNDRIDRMLRVLERQAAGGGGGGEWNMHVHSNSVDPHVVASIAKTHWNAQLVGVRL